MTYKKLDEKPLPIALITAGEETQMRYATRAETVDQYAELFASGNAWPFDTKLVVFKDNEGNYWLADGFHRLRASEKVGRESVHCVIYEGELSEAQDYALAANAKHGLRRTNEDKRKAIEVALSMERWEAKSDRAIAEHIGVDHKTVGKIRQRTVSTGEVPQLNAEPTGEVPQLKSTDTGKTEIRVGRDGKKRKVTTPPPMMATTPESKPHSSDSELPEVVQEVRAVLRSHFNEDELPVEEVHCKAIAVVDKEAWPLVVERAREQAASRDSDPKIQDFRDAAKEENWRHKRKLAEKYGVLAMQALDELHEIKRNGNRHSTGMKQIQAFLNELRGWS